MTLTRLFEAQQLSINSTIDLSPATHHHVAHVLRANLKDTLIIFNGQGGEYTGIIQHIEKKFTRVFIQEYHAVSRESPLNISLIQGVSRGEKMDFTIQKSVELGVKKILPIFTDYCNVKLDALRLQKKIDHWQSVIISAAEQSGRTLIPELLSPVDFNQALTLIESDLYCLLTPNSTQSIHLKTIAPHQRIVLLIGPEGGISKKETQLALASGYQSLNLCPRILRTETAALAALSAFQSVMGDM